MKKIKWGGVLLLIGLLILSNAYAKTNIQEVQWQMDTSSVWQSLGQTSDNQGREVFAAGFLASNANLQMFAKVNEGIDVYAEWYLSSRHHMADVYDNSGYVLVKSFPANQNFLGMNALLNFIDIRAGHFEIEHGLNSFKRSDNADVHKNPLIGNYLIDPDASEAGMEIRSNEGGFFNWVYGLGNGVTSEKWSPDRGTSSHGMVWIGQEGAPYRASLAFYNVNHANGTNTSALFSTSRGGSQYAAVIDGLTSADSGKINIAKYQISSLQFDFEVNMGPLAIEGMYGRVRDGDNNGSGAGEKEDIWNYYGAQLKYQLNPAIYLATRLSKADAQKLSSVDSNTIVSRFQLGFGYKMVDDVLWKAEWVSQVYDNYTASNGAVNPHFSGFVTEVSLPLMF